jgi:hypothetical protein
MKKKQQPATVKVVVAFTLETYNDPSNAAALIAGRLVCPAVKSLEILDAQTNYVLHDEPSDDFRQLRVTL